jgi:hypothetical protein
VKRKTMAAAGTHVVEIEGPMQYLRYGINPETFLIPVLVPDKSMECEGCSFPQRYIYFPRKFYRDLALKGRTNTLSFNKKLLEKGIGELQLKKYNLDKFPHGLYLFSGRQMHSRSQQWLGSMIPLNLWNTGSLMGL